MKAVGYCRVSTAVQAHEGISLDAQHRKIRLKAELRGWELHDCKEDAGFSGKEMTRRPALQQIINMVEQRAIDCLIIAKIDRLTRSVRDSYLSLIHI